LFSALHFGFFRNFESVVGLLATRGHQVHLIADEPDALGGTGVVEALASRYPAQVTWGWAPSYRGEAWFPVARKLRQGIDWLRFLDERYSAFPKLRERAAERAPCVLTSVLRVPGARTGWARRALRRALEGVDRAMPRCAAMDEYLRAQRPDVLLLASVTNPRAPQLDHLRSARAAGIRTGVCVYSWDHLSSKALIRVVPDRVFVWNDTQRREAVDLHGLPDDRIIVTGAQCYDQWFGSEPSRTRTEFCVSSGLDPERPFLVYLCSALTPDPRESRFVERWIRAIRNSAVSSLQGIGIVIRPHPERRREWEEIDVSGFGNVVIAEAIPTSAEAKADYFDAVAHSDGVVGLVTSAFLEAAIIGRPVLTVLEPELWRHQEGMLHFRYLLEVEDGLLTVARGLPEHIEQLGAALAGRLSYRERQRRFLVAFVRPGGMDRPATPVFVDGVERLAAGPAPGAPHLAAGPPVVAARTLVLAAGRWPVRSLLMDAREATEERARAARIRASRRESRLKSRRHRRRKLIMRVQWRLKRVRELLAHDSVGPQD
jgi:hypothetical protein